MISLFGGSGFVGSTWSKHTKFHFQSVPRDRVMPVSSESLYLISTTHNYWVHQDPLRDIQTNLTRLLETLQHVRKGETFNFVSSWFVYGDHGGRICHEDSYCDPRGFYSITKRAAEQLLISYCETKGIRWRIFRLSNIFGPGDTPSPQKNALQWLIGELAQDKPISLYYGGDCLRDYLWSADAASALDLCLERAPLASITNIGYGESRHFGDLICLAREHLFSRSPMTPIPPSDFHKQVQTKDFRMDTSRLRALGFTPKITPEEGIQLCCLRTSRPALSPVAT